MRRALFFSILVVCSPLLSAQDMDSRRNPRSVIRVNSTCQPHDIQRPWAKKAPFTRAGVGAVIGDGRVLVTAEMVKDHIIIELEKPGSAEKSPARLIAVDFEANLALLEANDSGFMSEAKPLDIDNSAVVGERLAVWQLEPNGTLISTEALVTNVAVLPYPTDSVMLLGYQLTSALQNKEGSFTLPLIKNGKLAGFSMRFDPRTQNLTAISAQVIEHFLAQSTKEGPRGFPKAGVSFASTRDPMFREFIGLDGQQGVYVTEVLAGGPGALAGILEGDVILEISGNKIDRDGNYEDPLHGKVSLIHLISGRFNPGDKVIFKLLREGKTLDVEVQLESRGPDTFVSPPYDIGEPPRFYIAAGLFFQELSRAYLQTFGNNWEQRANQRLVYYDRYQNTLFPEGNRRIVFLRGVIPTEGTMGYEDLDSLVVTKINNKTILRLEDIVDAFKEPMDGFHRIELEDDPGLIFLDAEKVETWTQTLKQVYGLPILQRLDP